MWEMIIPIEFLPLFFVVAWLYSSVGHGGASGYLALFALLGVARQDMVPVALALNIVVAGISGWHFHRQGYLRWNLLLPLIVASVPAAWLGAQLHVDRNTFGVLLGAALLFAAWRLLASRRMLVTPTVMNARRLWLQALPIGGILGMLAGMTGIGGGVFLSPLLLLLRWTDVRESAAVSSVFIVLNSMSGLLAGMGSRGLKWQFFFPTLFAVLAGAILGSRAGALWFRPATVRWILAVVLLLAGGKLLAGALL
jgi:uncharacterized membrane protein YfcA